LNFHVIQEDEFMLTQRDTSDKRPQRITDVPGCIKYVLLAFLVLLLIAELSAGEFSRQTSWLSWLILAIKLLLIAGLIVLIFVQRDLKCEITDPSGCTEETPDPTAGTLTVTVKGTAAGIAFGGYTLEVTKGSISYPGIVAYPGGTSSGTAPVVSGILGVLDTTSLSDGAYTITLRVFPLGFGTTKTCTATFDLLKTIVYMNRAGGAQAVQLPANNPNPFDPLAELAVGGTPRAIGGSLTIKGSAYIYECLNRKIKKYEIRYAQVASPGTEPAQPAKGAAIPGTWPVANTINLLEYTVPDQYQFWTRVGPLATDLINTWTTFMIGASTYYKLTPGSWYSGAAGSGRFSFLLTAEDTSAVTFHDIQHLWLDNRVILGQIVKLQRWNAKNNAWEDIPPCTDLLLSFGTIRILGLAWDPVIDTAWWPATAPNDNFDHYDLVFWKQFSPTADAVVSGVTSRVPALPAMPPVLTPTVADAGQLATWNLTLLDALNLASPVNPANRLAREESCTYDLQLFVTDNTLVNDGSTTHYKYHTVPLKIINDL
jgi:hypothetical protein